VDGAFCSRRFGPTDKLAPLLARHFTVFAYDRRGRGESGDTAPYAVAREVEDLAALIAVAGGSACVFGMSSGGVLALEAAAQGLPIGKLAVYEPPFLVEPVAKLPPADYQAQLRRLVEAGDRGGAVKFYMTRIMQMPAPLVAIMPMTPNWAQLKASAPSLLHEAAMMGDFHLPRERLARISTPTLVMAGGKGLELMRRAADAVASAVPGARREVLAGQSHDVSMPILAPVLASFFG
jgi:pimeloyl-ACP methyl ester carboxylesterase